MPGAAGTIGLARFVSAERGRPDALLVTGLVMVAGIATTRSVASLADATPIARLTGEHEVIVVPAASPHRTIQDLLDAFVAAPASVSWGGGSAGGTDDLLVRLIAEALHVAPAAANYVAFSGGGEALAAVLGGQVTAGVSGYGEFAQSIATGQLRALASSAPAREATLDAPTLRESGVALDLANWRGVVAPPGISAAEQEALTRRVRALVASPSWRETLARTGWTDAYLDGAAFRQFLLAEQARVRRRARPPAGTVGASGRRLAADGADRARRDADRGRRSCRGSRLAAAHRRSRRWRRGHRAGGRPRRDARRCQAIALPLAGFVPVATVLFASTSRALGSRRLLRDVALGAALAGTLAVLFAWGLGVPLPSGGELP